MPLKAIAFDAYGTLFDVYSVSSLAEELFPEKAHSWLLSGATNKSNTPACAPCATNTRTSGR